MAVIGFKWCSCRRAPQRVTCSLAKGLHLGWGVCQTWALCSICMGLSVLEGWKAPDSLEVVAIILAWSLNFVPPLQILFHPPRNSPATSFQEEASQWVLLHLPRVQSSLLIGGVKRAGGRGNTCPSSSKLEADFLWEAICQLGSGAVSIDQLHLQLSSANYRSLTLQGDCGGVLGSLEALRSCNGPSTLSNWVGDAQQHLAVSCSS